MPKKYINIFLVVVLLIAGVVWFGKSVLAWTDTITAWNGTTGTLIKAVHVNELRTAINVKRGEVGLPPGVWAEAINAGTTKIKASHIQEMKVAIYAVYEKVYTTLLGGTPTAASKFNAASGNCLNGELWNSPTRKILAEDINCLRAAVDNAPTRLVSDATHNHTVQDCISQTVRGGTLVKDSLGNRFCQFYASSCPAGWTQYGNWSQATSHLEQYQEYTIEDAHNYCGGTLCTTSGQNCTVTNNSYCDSGSKSWSNATPVPTYCTALKNPSYRRWQGCTGDSCPGNTNLSTCSDLCSSSTWGCTTSSTATISYIGCY